MTRLYVLDKEAWERQIDKPSLLEEEAGVREYENGLVLPVRNFVLQEYPGASYFEGGVIDCEGNFVAGMARKNTHAIANMGLIRGYEVREDKIEYCDEEVVFGGMLRHQYGHFLVDSTSRFWYLENCIGRKKIVFVEDDEIKFDPHDMLELAGIAPDTYEVVKRPKRYKKIIVPDETAFSLTANYKKEWVRFFDKVRDSVEPSPYKKVYLTRTAFFDDDIVNEEYFEKFYSDHGFHVVAPETLTLKEQVSLMAGADDVACSAGTLSHAILFAKPKTRLHLLNRVKEPLRQQIVVCKARGCELISIDAFKNYLPTKHGGCCALFAPNDNWNAYISQEFNEEPDFDYINNELPKMVVKYLEKWGERFQLPQNYICIKDWDLNEVLTSINETKFSKRMQINCIPESKKITNLRKRAVERAAQTQKLAIADKIVALKDSYVVSGFVDKFPFCKWDSLEFRMKVKGGEVDFDVPLETEIVEDEKLHWEAKIDYETLREHIEEPKRSNWQKQICNFVIAITSADGEQLELKVVSLQGCC